MQRVLLIGSETMSRIVDWEDRSTAILFGDGAGAVVLEQGAGPGRLLGWDLGSDGSLRHILHADVGGTIEMDGPEVFRRAVRIMVDSAERALDRAGLTVDDVDLFVPHQANSRIIASARAKLGIPEERTADILATTGNTSAASIPMALADAADAGRLHRATSCSSSASVPACPGPPPCSNGRHERGDRVRARSWSRAAARASASAVPAPSRPPGTASRSPRRPPRSTSPACSP